MCATRPARCSAVSQRGVLVVRAQADWPRRPLTAAPTQGGERDQRMPADWQNFLGSAECSEGTSCTLSLGSSKRDEILKLYKTWMCSFCR
jgi:hypothetical protein